MSEYLACSTTIIRPTFHILERVKRQTVRDLAATAIPYACLAAEDFILYPHDAAKQASLRDNHRLAIQEARAAQQHRRKTISEAIITHQGDLFDRLTHPCNIFPYLPKQRTYACDIAAYRSISTHLFGHAPTEDAIFAQAEKEGNIKQSLYGPIVIKPDYWEQLSRNRTLQVSVTNLKGLTPNELTEYLHFSIAHQTFLFPSIASRTVVGALHREIIYGITREDVFINNQNTDPEKPYERIPKKEFLQSWAQSSFSIIIVEVA